MMISGRGAHDKCVDSVTSRHVKTTLLGPLVVRLHAIPYREGLLWTKFRQKYCTGATSWRTNDRS